MSTGGELVPSSWGGSPFGLSKQDWDQHKEWHGKFRIIHALQGSPVGRSEEEQRDYATLLVSWLTHEGPLPPPIASPERQKRREKQHAKKHQHPPVGMKKTRETTRRRDWRPGTHMKAAAPAHRVPEDKLQHHQSSGSGVCGEGSGNERTIMG